MARAKVATTRKDDPALPVPAAPGREIPADAAEILARYGARASSVKVWRYNDDKMDYEYVKTIPVAEFSEDRLQLRWGGGKYRGDVLDGKSQHVGPISPMLIAGEPLPIRGEARVLALSTAAPAVPTQEAPLAERIKEWIVIGGAAVAAIAPIVKMLKSDGGGNVVETMNLVENAYRRGREDGREVGELKAERPETGKSIGDVAAEALPAIIGMVRESNAQRALAPALVSTMPAPPAPAPVAPPAPSPMPEGFAWLADMRRFLPLLQQAAGAGADDADYWGGIAVARMTDEQVGTIARVAARPEFEAIVCAAFPEIPQREWLAEFVAAIKAGVLHDPLEA